MIDNAIKNVDAPSSLPAKPLPEEGIKVWLPILSCACAYILSVLVSISPLYHIAGFTTHFFVSRWLTHFGSWLPVDVTSGESTRETQRWTQLREWLILLVISFVACAVCGYFINRRLQKRNDPRTRLGIYGVIVAVVLATSFIYFFAPVTVATDMFSYASYGRLMTVYFTNPYFVPPSAYPHDVVYQWLYWKNTMSIYGPIWMVLSGILALVGGSSQFGILLIFRALAFICHLINIFLVYKGLKVLGRSEKTVALGTLLYAWNPLVLVEGVLGAHNDISMVTFLILGLYLCAKAQREGTFVHLRGYLPPLFAFTAATLVKFSAAPSLAVLVLALICATAQANRTQGKPGWMPALRSALIASVIFLVVAGVLYSPFWIGHSLGDIWMSFTAQPSSVESINSILSTFAYYNTAHALPAFLNILKSHRGWSVLNIIGMLLPIVIGIKYLWRSPDTKTMALIIIISFAGFLITAPWFFSWYLTWIVGLVPFVLPMRSNRFVRAVVAYSLTYSGTAFFSYYTTWVGWMRLNHAVPQIFWSVEINVIMIGLPVLVFFVTWAFWPFGLKFSALRPSTNVPVPLATDFKEKTVTSGL